MKSTRKNFEFERKQNITKKSKSNALGYNAVRGKRDNESPLNKFLQQLKNNNENIEAWDGKPHTHCKIGGGGGFAKICIPDRLIPEFYQKYAEAISQGYYIPYHEQRSQIFRLYFDLDISSDFKLNSTHVTQMCVVLQKAVKKFYESAPKNEFDRIFKLMVVSTKQGSKFFENLLKNDEETLENEKQAQTFQPLKVFSFLDQLDDGNDLEPQQTVASVSSSSTHAPQVQTATPHAQNNPQESNVIYKIGIHIHFSNLFVDLMRAFEIRAFVVAELIQAFKENSTYKSFDWEKIVDMAVYDKGLRMAYAHKAEECRACVNELGRKCKKCLGGYVVKSSYIPSIIFDENMCVDVETTKRICRQDTVDLDAGTILQGINFTSLRVPSSDTLLTGYYVVPPNAPSPNVPQMLKRSKKDPSGYVLKNDGTHKSKNLKEVVDPKIIGAIQNLINDSFDSAYKGTLVTKILIHRRENNGKIQRRVKRPELEDVYYLANVDKKSLGSRYCQNVNRSHNHNTVFFKIHHTGISQHCFSKNRCSNYASKSLPLDKTSLYTLFGEFIHRGGEPTGPNVSKRPRADPSDLNGSHEKLRAKVGNNPLFDDLDESDEKQ